MNPAQFRQYNILLIVSSFAYLSSVYLTRNLLGCACFIFSSCLVMFLRIAMSYNFIKQYFERHGYRPNLPGVIPSLTTLISLVGVFLFLSINQHYLLDLEQPPLVILSVIMGGWSLLFIILVILRHEEALVDFASRLFKLKSH